MNKHLHHFYLLDTQKSEAEDVIKKYLDENLEKSATPVYTFEVYETFTVEDARNLKTVATEAGDESAPRIVGITASSFTGEALQALLKTFEEPAPHVHFFVSYPGIKNLPDTIRSRAEIITTDKKFEIDFDAKKFIKKNSAERLKDVAKFIDRHEDDESSGALRAEAKEILIALLNELRENSTKDMSGFKQKSKIILSFLPPLEGRGANVKMILEHIALVI